MKAALRNMPLDNEIIDAKGIEDKESAIIKKIDEKASFENLENRCSNLIEKELFLKDFEDSEHSVPIEPTTNVPGYTFERIDYSISIDNVDGSGKTRVIGCFEQDDNSSTGIEHKTYLGYSVDYDPSNKNLAHELKWNISDLYKKDESGNRVKIDWNETGFGFDLEFWGININNGVIVAVPRYGGGTITWDQESQSLIDNPPIKTPLFISTDGGKTFDIVQVDAYGWSDSVIVCNGIFIVPLYASYATANMDTAPIDKKKEAESRIHDWKESHPTFFTDFVYSSDGITWKNLATPIPVSKDPEKVYKRREPRFAAGGTLGSNKFCIITRNEGGSNYWSTETDGPNSSQMIVFFTILENGSFVVDAGAKDADDYANQYYVPVNGVILRAAGDWNTLICATQGQLFRTVNHAKTWEVAYTVDGNDNVLFKRNTGSFQPSEHPLGMTRALLYKDGSWFIGNSNGNVYHGETLATLKYISSIKYPKEIFSFAVSSANDAAQRGILIFGKKNEEGSSGYVWDVSYKTENKVLCCKDVSSAFRFVKDVNASEIQDVINWINNVLLPNLRA